MFKKICCILLCLCCLMHVTACKKGTTASKQSTTSKKEIKTSSQAVSSAPNEVDEFMANFYGFSEIKKVNYYCAKNTPKSDSIYVVSSVTTDKEEKKSIDLKLICSNEDIKINGKSITIPYEYTKKHKSVKLNALHEPTGISCDFTLKFEDKWELTFEDNFDGTELNTDVWNVWDEMRDWRYAYSKDNIFLDGKGNLINRMSVSDDYDAETGEGRFTGTITTLDKFEQTYGYYEIRMIPNLTSGLWSAFWLVGGDMSDKDAADDGSAENGFEVDIVETYYYRTDPAQTIHWDGYYNDQTKSKSFKMAGLDHIFDGDYHTFAFRWGPDEYAFLIDGEVTNTTSEMGICNMPAYVLVSAHYGNAGEFVMKPGEYSDMIVDYVKVYQSPTDPKE